NTTMNRHVILLFLFCSGSMFHAHAMQVAEDRKPRDASEWWNKSPENYWLNPLMIPNLSSHDGQRHLYDGIVRADEKLIKCGLERGASFDAPVALVWGEPRYATTIAQMFDLMRKEGNKRRNMVFKFLKVKVAAES